MSSNNNSPAEKLAKRSKKTRKNTIEYEERVLGQVGEMFDSIFDRDVILSVVENCNWKLQPSIEHLITLSANVDSSTDNNFGIYNENRSASAENPNSSPEDDAFEVDTDFTYLKINEKELQEQKEEFKKFELMRKQNQDFSLENRPSFTNVVNESPLETIEDEETALSKDSTLIRSHDKVSKNTSRDNSTYPLFSRDEKDFSQNLLTCDQNQLPTFNPEGSSEKALKNQAPNLKTEEKRKTETESLCGLKIQYRFGGLESNSDDDADVVIEEEISEYNISIPQNSQTNVCQFLSLSTQSPPKMSRPRAEMINTPSPFSSPVNKNKFKACQKATQNRIKSTIQNGFKIMVIMRGLPGSGKSYLAREIVQSTIGGDPMQYIFSTDDFFMRKRGIYDFDPNRLSDAHAFNQQQVLKAMRAGRSPVIVDNTNSQCWEMQPYVYMAVKYGYFIEVLEPDTPWAKNVNELTRRNEHGVPKESIRRMLNRFEKNITGAELPTMLSFKYNPYNTPPQPCFPVSSSKTKQVSPGNSVKAKKENKKLPETEEKLEDYVPVGFSSARVVDAIPNPYEKLSALELAMKTFGGDDEDLSPKGNDQDLIQDKWEDDGISWEDEMLEMKIKNKNSDALKETLNEESSSMDNKVKNCDDVSHLNLGAIGSERKNSVVKHSFANNSDESDKLIIDGIQTYSVGSAIEYEKDQEKENEESLDKSYSPTISDEKTQSPTEELKDLQNTIEKDSPDCGTKSSNTESFEHIDSNSEDLSLEIREAADTNENVESSTECLENSGEVEKDPGNLKIDPQDKVSFGSIMKFIKKSILGANNDASEIKNSEEVVENGFQMPETSKTVTQGSFEKSLENEAMIKNSDIDILDFYSSMNFHENINANGSNTENPCISNLSESEDNSEDKVKEPIKLTGPLARAVLTLEENEKLILEEKKLREMSENNNCETTNSKTKNSKIKNKGTKKSNTISQYFGTFDNINSISWKESPFPAFNMEVPIKLEESRTVTTSDASTNTDIYDFNVLYVGGTEEPQYKILNAVNRSINEGFIPTNLEVPPPLKLKLDKSSMTNEVDVLLELPTISGETDMIDEDMVQGLIDMFPHISQDYVIDVYKNLCLGNFYWAIDVLLDGVPGEEISSAQPLNSSTTRNEKMQRIEQSSGSDSDESESCSWGRKKEKNHVSEDSETLKKYLEEKVMISEASYNPHILRVKKWKNREPDMSIEEIMKTQARNTNVLQFVNDLSPTDVDTAESSTSSRQSSPTEEDLAKKSFG